MTPTVLIFLRAPILGEVKTRLAVDVGEAEALRIYRWLAERQLAAIPPDWPVEVHFTPATEKRRVMDWLGGGAGRTFFAQPEGVGLGERLIHATEGAFGRGAEGAFLIGADCFGLDTRVLAEAAAGWEKGDTVLGPARDGGYYLLGIHRVNPELFTGISWGSERVAAQTREHLMAAGMDWRELPVLRDVDTLADWQAVQRDRAATLD